MARLRVTLTVSVPDRPGLSPVLLVSKTLGFDSSDVVVHELNVEEDDA